MTHPSDAAAVPLAERLLKVPFNAVLRIDTPNALGCMDTHSIPVGRYCHEAAAALAPSTAPSMDSRGGVEPTAPQYKFRCASHPHFMHGCQQCIKQNLDADTSGDTRTDLRIDGGKIPSWEEAGFPSFDNRGTRPAKGGSDAKG